MAVGDDTGATGLAVGAGVSSGWQANSNNPTARASMTTVVIVRTGPVRSVELCSFKHPRGEIQIEEAGASVSCGYCIRCLHRWLKESAQEERLYWGMDSRFHGSNGWGARAGLKPADTGYEGRATRPRSERSSFVG